MMHIDKFDFWYIMLSALKTSGVTIVFNEVHSVVIELKIKFYEQKKLVNKYWLYNVIDYFDSCKMFACMCINTIK